MSFDVVIIGAGPAGFSAACSLALHGVDTLLCEAEHIPADKMCGEAILPNGVLHLERLGVAREELRAVGRPLTGVRYFAPSGASAETAFAEGPGIAVRRTELSKILHRRALKLDSLTVVDNSRARVESTGCGFRVEVDGKSINPRLLIGADGLNSGTRGAAALPTANSLPERFALGQHFQCDAWTDCVEVYWGEGTQAYVTPIAPDQMQVAFLLNGRRANDTSVGSLLRALPALRRKLAGARMLLDPRAAGPMHQDVPRSTRDGLVLIGDAAGYVDSIAGEGIGLAAGHGVLLSEIAYAVHRARRESRVVTELELRGFARAAHKISEHNQELTRWLLQLSRHPKLLERTVDVFAREPVLFQHFVTASMGLVSPYAVPALASVRALTRLAVPNFTVPPQLGPHPSH